MDAHRAVGALRNVPGIRAFNTYQRGWLRSDVVAGVVLAAILVPQGMAYAELAGLPPVTGLYTTLACLVGYALMGPSRVLVLGPDSAVSPLIFAAIAPLAVAGDPETAIALAGMMAIMVGLILVGLGIAETRFRRRSALEGGPGRVHERAGDHDRHRSAAQVVRILDRRRRLRRGRAGVLERVRRAQLDGDGPRLDHVGGSARAAPLHTNDSRCPRRRGRCDGRDRRLRPGCRHGRVPPSGPASARGCPGPTPAMSAHCWQRPSASSWCR